MSQAVRVQPEVADVDHRIALRNMLPERVATSVFCIPEDYQPLTEDELCGLFPKKKPTITDAKLRTAFWREHARATSAIDRMDISKVYRGVCSRTHFYDRILPDKVRLAYITLPPSDYEVAMEEFTNYGLDSLRKCFDDAIDDFRINKDPKMYESIRKTVEMLIVHTRGEPIRRVEQKNLNMNVTAPSDTARDMIDISDIDRQLKELEQACGEPIEVHGTRLENNE